MARQPEAAPKGAGVKALSSRLLQMKFMKRGQAAETVPQAAYNSATAAKVTLCIAVFMQCSCHGRRGLCGDDGLLMGYARVDRCRNLCWTSGGTHLCF